MLQTCFTGSNLEGEAPFLILPFRLQTKCPVRPPTNLVSAQSLIYILSCFSVPVISFLTVCDQLPHHALMVSTVKFVAFQIPLDFSPPLKFTLKTGKIPQMLSSLWKHWGRRMGSWQVPSAGRGPVDSAQGQLPKGVLGFMEQLKSLLSQQGTWQLVRAAL